MFMIDLSVESYYSMLGISPDASAKEVRAAQTKLVEELRIKARDTQDKQEKSRLEEREVTINKAGNTLSRPDEREKYDQENAHLKFFLIQPVGLPFYYSAADRLYITHQVLRHFLAEKGCKLLPLTETINDDFSADETPNELLDNLLR